jgi:hypothetical protein
MNISLTCEHFKVLLTQGYSLDMIFLLTAIKEEIDLSELLKEKKIALIHQTLLRKALITNENRLTAEGKTLLTFLSSPVESSVKIEKRKPIEDDKFNRWWNAYPGTDTFEHKGTKFTGSRSLRVRKDECRLVITKIIGEGEYTIDDLVGALELEVLQKKENSVKTKVNRLTFMQNSLTYLNQRTFEPFIELVRKDVVVEEQTAGGVDI